MKALTFLSLFVMTAFAAHAQNNCAKFKNGTFKTTYNGLSIIIKRVGNYQQENMISPKVTVSYTVAWIDDCTYTLKPNEDLFKYFPNTPKNALVTVKIVKTKADSYTQTSTSNFNKITVTSEVIKIH